MRLRGFGSAWRAFEWYCARRSRKRSVPACLVPSTFAARVERRAGPRGKWRRFPGRFFFTAVGPATVPPASGIRTSPTAYSNLISPVAFGSVCSPPIKNNLCCTSKGDRCRSDDLSAGSGSAHRGDRLRLTLCFCGKWPSSFGWCPHSRCPSGHSSLILRRRTSPLWNLPSIIGLLPGNSSLTIWGRPQPIPKIYIKGEHHTS